MKISLNKIFIICSIPLNAIDRNLKNGTLQMHFESRTKDKYKLNEWVIKQ